MVHIKRGLLSDKNQKETTTLTEFKRSLAACSGSHVSVVYTLASGIKKTIFVTVDLFGVFLDTYTEQPLDIKSIWLDALSNSTTCAS